MNEDTGPADGADPYEAGAPDTEPPDTEPPDTEPPDTEPPDTEPPDTEPPDTEPPDTEPPDTEPPDAGERRRPRARWYLLPAGLLLGSLAVGLLVFWAVVHPLLETHQGSPLRLLLGFVVLVVVVGAGFLAAFVAALVIAVRRSGRGSLRGRRGGFRASG